MNSTKKYFKTGVGLLIASALCASALWAQQQKNPVPNHSIFDGTMVHLSWPEVKKAAEESSLVLLPVAVIEQHGPHLCLGTDTYIGYKRSVALKQKLESNGIKTVIAPPLYWGIMQLNESGAFPGSFTVSPSTMKGLLADIFADLHRWGFRHVYCFNHHGDGLHIRSLNEAIAEAKEKLGLKFYNDREREDGKKVYAAMNELTAKLYKPDYHSGAFETSFMMDHYPEFVNVEKAKTLKPESTWQPSGYVGDPANFRSVDTRQFNEADIKNAAHCIADWYRSNR